MNDPLNRLIGEFARLPGIGIRTATRLAHHLLKVPSSEAKNLAASILEIKERLINCSLCNAITEIDPCALCTDPERDGTKLCVVEEPFNIQPMERTGEYFGRYHVLMGALSPQRGIGPNSLRIPGLMDRLEGVEEVILATNPSVEGEATALYLARLLKSQGVGVSRLAFGMPVGGDIEYTDEVTLARSLAGRRNL
jgi:recombination protein RecR